MDKKNKDKKMINITNIVRNYLEHNIGMQNVLRARVEHFINLSPIVAKLLKELTEF